MATPLFHLHPSWREALSSELEQPYIGELSAFLTKQRDQGRTIFPPQDSWFRALDLCPLDEVRVVILGQDPYHGPDQAHGLCFSVPGGVRPPPSLVNIFKEMGTDLGIARSSHGSLDHWARQGVLLLNSVLTVETGKAASHRGRGWERFTDAVVRAVNDRGEPAVFMLWGNYAQDKAGFVDDARHLVLKAPHPSPLSAYTGFFGCRHFSQANAFLEEQGLPPVAWALPQAAAAE
jgi:uracil-DNA glycosylase